MKQRITQLQKQLSKSDAAFLITSDVNRFYFTEFSSSAGVVLITKNNAYLLVDFRYGELAEKTVKDCKTIVFRNFWNSIETVCKEEKIRELLAEHSVMTLSQAEDYRRKCAEFGVTLAKENILDKCINDMRAVKSPDEIEKISRAQKITEEAYLEVLNYVKAGVSERKIALELEYLMRKKGADGISFDLITITGKNTSLPHGVPSDDIVQEGDFFLSDIGAVYQGYHSDMTRTVAVHHATDEMYEIYHIVQKAQTEALKKIKAGVTAGLIDTTARNVIEDAGRGKYFGHSTGHGVGLDIHEKPTVYKTNTDILASGMVITVEPGIYLPEKFGVRIEDMVTVTENGCDNFADIDKSLIII